VTDVPVLSFFTGAGFLDLGFKKEGFKTVWFNEYFKPFVSSFDYAWERMGFSSRISNSASITELGPRQILKEAFGTAGRPEHFGVIGGPPCPDFSVGGKNKGGSGRNGILSQVYVSRICELGPSFFVFENVPGLVRTAKHRQFLGGLIKRLTDSYVIDLRVICSLDYGVPQDRSRMIMVGVSKKFAHKRRLDIQQKPVNEILLNAFDNSTNNPSWFDWRLKRKYHDAKAMFDWPTESKFGSVPIRPSEIPTELMVGPLICDPKELAGLENQNDHFHPYSKRFKEVPEGSVAFKSFKRLHRWRFSPAAAYGNNEVHLHPTQARRLSVREALRIQTVPDNYVLPADMPLSHKFKTVGNGVPVKLAQAVAATMSKLLAGGGNGKF